MGIPMNYGTCEGGPFHGKQMAHHEPSMKVAIEKRSKKVAPAVVAGDDYNFGDYTWDGSVWVWSMIPSARKP